MTKDEYVKLFHKEELNLVAFKQLLHCDDEVLRLVNAAIKAEREACAQACERTDDGTPYNLADECAAAIRSRSEK